MTEDDKINLFYFITRTGMYIHSVDDTNVVSFIHGYELGTNHRCDFAQLCKQLLSDKYDITSSADGWDGQLRRLANTLSQSWMILFKRTALDVIADERQGGLDKVITKVLRTRITSLIEQINALGDTWFNESWSEEWLSLCAVESTWFKELWTNSEWNIIQSINKEVQANNIFSKKDSFIPMPELLALKNQYY